MGHRSVLMAEALEALSVRPSGRYVDGTLGMGGHTEAIAERLGPEGRVLALDVDASAIAKAHERLARFGDRVVLRQGNFRNVDAALDAVSWDEVDGMLFDLGISSIQLDDPSRGLSFQAEGPLDMRMDPTRGKTALVFLQTTDEESLADLFRSYGEFRNVRRLARTLTADAASGALRTTRDLASVCERVLGRHGPAHPATRVFLSLRAAVNEEPASLSDVLRKAPRRLKNGGRIAVITFQSTEDRAVKERFRSLAQEGEEGRRYALLVKKPLTPGEAEVRENPRARSAKLRILERTS